MRLIDADRLLEERRLHLYYHLPNGDTAIPIIDIKHAPTVDNNEWIPVSEHLPNDNEDVLAYCVYEDDSSRIVPANYFNGEFYNCIFNAVMRCGITHWMPLPKPPKEEGEQK